MQGAAAVPAAGVPVVAAPSAQLFFGYLRDGPVRFPAIAGGDEGDFDFEEVWTAGTWNEVFALR